MRAAELFEELSARASVLRAGIATAETFAQERKQAAIAMTTAVIVPTLQALADLAERLSYALEDDAGTRH